MTRVLLIGETDSLGRVLLRCAPEDIELITSPQDDAKNVELIINVSRLTPESGVSAAAMASRNSVLPHLLADVGKPVIHVSTDCVFGSYGPGGNNPHRSCENPAPDSLYGRTMLAGESENSINVRTSWVGPSHGLWKWAAGAAQRRETIAGWTEAWWSGSTEDAIAHALFELIRDPGPPRTIHMATEAPISKHNLLVELREQQELQDLAINATQEPRINRSLHPDIVLPAFASALKEILPK